MDSRVDNPQSLQVKPEQLQWLEMYCEKVLGRTVKSILPFYDSRDFDFSSWVTADLVSFSSDSVYLVQFFAARRGSFTGTPLLETYDVANVAQHAFSMSAIANLETPLWYDSLLVGRVRMNSNGATVGNLHLLLRGWRAVLG